MKKVSILLVSLCGAFVLATSPGGIAAQESPLATADRFVNEGRFAEARELLAEWFETQEADAGRVDRQHAIWLRAILTPDFESSELDFRRLVIEYPGGAYSDAALLRLAQGARAWGDLEAARQYLEILVRDYPQSPLRVEARTFLARLDQPPALTGIVSRPGGSYSGDGPGDAPSGGASAAPATPAPPTQRSEPSVPAPARETGSATPLPDSSIPAPAPEIGPAAGPPTSAGAELPPQDFAYGIYALQLGAFSTALRAGELAAEAEAAGLDVRIVRVQGSDLIRVRVGAFPTRAQAEARARELRELGFDAVVSADREREIGL